MADYQACFKRYETKFLLDGEQRRQIERLIDARMVPDAYAENDVFNIYYDTPDFRLVRRSLEKPVYKEKLRMRSYGPAGPDDAVFLELKKKYRDVVYKRRISVDERAAAAGIAGDAPLPDSQIGREIASVCGFYGGIAPRVFLSYSRDAFSSAEDSSLRVTLDRNILWRSTELTLNSEAFGDALLPDGMSLMEIKSAQAIPLWLVNELSRLHVYKTSFSKYGEAYTKLFLTNYDMRCSTCSTTYSPQYSAAIRLPA